MHTYTRIRKLVMVGAALVAAIVAVEMKFNTYAAVSSASHQSAKIENRIGVETVSIIASDASVSTYGLDSARTVDW